MSKMRGELDHPPADITTTNTHPVLNGTAKVLHKTTLPAGTTRAQGVAMLHDHAFFLSCDPHLIKFSELKADDPRVTAAKDAGKRPPLPERVPPMVAVPGRTRRFYEVHDLVHNLPMGLWDSNVVSTCEMTDIEGGLFVRLHSPMGVVMDTFWGIAPVEGAAEGEAEAFELVEEITISASRLLVGLVKSLCEGGWQKIHDKMVERLRTELEAGQKTAA